ncbi:PAS domain-containing protein [Fodinicurvata sediminis]|uniref:PAS domain-containing protein n=1 Tax=Fodinicurvata sediminis TaxID=1121832 RepID=UPI0003B42EDE|nr:PAS domain-containing protein [Fodinicurvata sediminis]
MTNQDSGLSLRHPQLKSLYREWVKLCGEGTFPMAADLDPRDLRPWLDHLVVIRITADGRFVYGYYNPNYAEIFDGDRVGQSLESLPEEQRRLLEAEYRQVQQERLPTSRIYTALFYGEEQSWERLVLPFFTPKGRVEKMLVGAYRLNQ